MNERKASEVLTEYGLKLAQLLYPGMKIFQKSSSSTGGYVNKLSLELDWRQKAFFDTPYEPGEEKRFSHYTSLGVLFSIFNTGSLWLYNLYNKNDSHEFDYLIKKWGISVSKGFIQKWKQSLFIASFCSAERADEFDMWRHYGQNGKGVSVVYNFFDNRTHWQDFLLGKVVYGSSNKASQRIMQAVELTDYYVSEKELPIDDIPKALAYLLLLHKDGIWNQEKEFRLITAVKHASDEIDYRRKAYLPRSSDMPEVTMGYELSEKGQRLSYLSLPLEKSGIANSNIPQIRIEEIILGYAHDDAYFEELKKYVHEYGWEKFGYNIQLRRSQFRENFS